MRPSPFNAIRCAAIGALALLAGCGSKDAAIAVPAGAEGAQKVGTEAVRLAAAIKPPTEMPALNGPVLGTLADGEPALQARLPQLEAGERTAIRHVVDEARARLAPAAVAAIAARTTWRAPLLSPVEHDGTSLLDFLIPTAGAADGGLDWPSLQTVAVGYMFTGFMGAAADGGHGEPGTEQMRSEFTEKSGEKASIVVKTEKDSQVTTELSTEITVPLFLVEANSKVSLTTRGLCPDVNGVVEFTITFNSGGHKDGGKNMAFNRTREAHVKATVNDDAEIAETDIDTRYGDRITGGGRQAWVEGATNWNNKGSTLDKLVVTKHELVRASQEARAEDQKQLDDGIKQTLLLGYTALEGAKGRWQSGACIRVDASSPGKVKRKAVSKIPVKVIHRLDGSEIAAKVKVELTGGESVDPAQIPRTPATLTHTAPDAKVATMSIKLTARSRRGMATETLKLIINEGSYDAVGGAGDFHGTGRICSLAAPFVISGSGVTVKFTPTSEQGGTYTYDGSIAGFHLFGHGTYRVIYRNEEAVEIFATGPGNVDDAGGAGDEHYKLTPTQAAQCDAAVN